MTWEKLYTHPGYEIFSEYDENLHCYPIRKIGKSRILKTSINNTGYVQICLDGVKYLVHRIIAEQFIINDDIENKTEIDHIDHSKNNNRINNLRWVSRLQNQNNKSRTRTGREIEFVQDLPDDVIVVNQYGKYHFNGYYYANDVFYKDTGNGDFRLVPWHYNQRYNVYDVGLIDENTIARIISKKTFYRLYGLD